MTPGFYFFFFQIMDRLEDLESDSGPVFMLINCAGTAIAAKFEDTSPEEFQRMIDVNYLGSVKVTQAILPKMKAREEGIVVFVSSQVGLWNGNLTRE